MQPTTPSQPKIKSKGLDVLKLWAEGKSKRKESMAFVVIGHVDHGKSTLMGRLLLDTGAVSQREIDKYKKQATELGKSSFALAWVMDTGSEERERGVTVDIAQLYFRTDKVDFTILDAPGHRDFVPNMIAGASMADVAVLVIDANQLDSGMKGQTREHVVLARASGLKKIIVAVNKMDSTTPEWDVNTFNEVRDGISNFLSTVGYTQKDVTFIPCSGLSGENVVKPASATTAPWVSKSHTTFLQALESAILPPPSSEIIALPFRMQISDVFRGSITNPLSVAGHITAGNIQTGETIVTQPSGERATIRSIEVADESKDFAVAGQICTLHLADIEQQHLRIGDLLCSAQHPAPVGKTFIVRLRALDVLLPQAVDVHVGRLGLAARIAALISIFDDKGEVVRKKPRIVKEDQRASIKLTLEESAALEVGGVVILRLAGSTVAVGRIVRVGG